MQVTRPSAKEIATLPPDQRAAVMSGADLPPGAKIKTQEAHDRLVALIVAGFSNKQINETMIADGHVDSAFSNAGLAKWRKKDIVIAAMNDVGREAMQAGYASKDFRVKKLAEMNDLLYDQITVERDVIDDETGEVIGRKRQLVDARRDTLLAVEQFRENIVVIGEIVDPKKAQSVTITGDINHSHRSEALGIARMDRAEVKDKLKELAEMLEAEDIIEGEVVESGRQGLLSGELSGGDDYDPANGGGDDE